MIVVDLKGAFKPPESSLLNPGDDDIEKKDEGGIKDEMNDEGDSGEDDVLVVFPLPSRFLKEGGGRGEDDPPDLELGCLQEEAVAAERCN